MGRGIEKYIESPEVMETHFENYKQWVVDNPILVQDYVGKDGNEVYRKKNRPLTYEGFCNYLAKNKIIAYPEGYFQNRDGRYNDFVNICLRIKQEIRQDQIDGGMAGVYNPSITQRINGLVERVQDDGTKEININVRYGKGSGHRTLPDAPEPSGYLEGGEAV